MLEATAAMPLAQARLVATEYLRQNRLDNVRVFTDGRWLNITLKPWDEPV
jgi:hypothetical protein